MRRTSDPLARYRGEFANKVSSSILPLAEGESRRRKARRQGVSSAAFVQSRLTVDNPVKQR
jgi:hypothetical protein